LSLKSPAAVSTNAQLSKTSKAGGSQCDELPSNKLMGPGFPSLAKVGRRGRTERDAKHVDEGAGGAVSGLEGGVSDLGTFGQEAHGVHEAQLLTPLAESHAGFFLKQALDGPSTGAALPTNLCQGFSITGISAENLRNSRHPGIAEVRQLQRDHLHGFELIDQHVDEMPLPADGLLKSAEGAGMQDQFAQERRYINHATIAR